MTQIPGRSQKALFIVGLFALMAIKAPLLAAGAVLTSIHFWWGVLLLMLMLGGYLAFR
jgi:hypothetical protein